MAFDIGKDIAKGLGIPTGDEEAEKNTIGSSSAPSLDMGYFMSTVNVRDMARPNIFKVIIPQLSSLAGDNVITPSSPTALQSIYNSRLFGKGVDALQERSSLLTKMEGAYQPGMARSLFGGDYLDFLGSNYNPETDVGLMVKSINIPDIQLDMTPNKLRRYSQNVVHGKSASPITMRVYCTSDYGERFYFEEWSKAIFDPRTSTVGFPADYLLPIEIYTYDRDGIATAVYTVNNAYPVRVGEVQLDWDSNNEVVVFDVELSYEGISSKKIVNEGMLSDLSVGGIDRIASKGSSIFKQGKTFFK